MARATSLRGGQRWENKYAYNTLAENADETEWSAVIHGDAHFSAGTLDDAMADAGDEFAADMADALLDEDRLQGQEMLQEARQGSVYEILIERISLLGDAYPFTIAGNSLVYQPGDIPIYELLLGICQAPSLTSTPYCELPRLFENLSMLAGCSYLGPRSDGYRTGWPRPEQVSHFKAAIEQLKMKSGEFPSEWQWQPAEHLPDDPAPKFIKEDGLDVVAWNRWPDQRTGQLYLLGQCACGKDWLKKDKDLDLRSLEEWFRLPRVEPVRSFFTPRYATKPVLNEMSRTAGLVFDRIRIVHALREPHVSPKVMAMRKDIVTAIDIARQLLPA